MSKQDPGSRTGRRPINQWTPLLFLVPSLVFARPPVPFDQWTVSNGAIDTDTSCQATGVTCETVAEQAGFIQQEVTTDSGRFVRLILTARDASGNPADLGFVNEYFTPFYESSDPQCTGSAAQDCQGIASQQTVRDLVQSFDSTVRVQRNFAKSNETDTALMFNTDIVQLFSDAAVSGRFALTNYTDWEFGPGGANHSTPIGRVMDIQQDTLIGDVDAGDTETRLRFDHRLRGGWEGRTINSFLPSLSQPITTAGQMDSPLGGTTIDWSDGDTITSTWLASNRSVLFSAQVVENRTAGTRATDSTTAPLSSGIVLEPMSWDAIFGDKPSFP